MSEENEFIKEMEEDVRTVMNTAYNELHDIVKPINVTKLTYTEKKRFLDNDGFGKAWKQIKKIIESHKWLLEQERN